jgi:hypothetical protein
MFPAVQALERIAVPADAPCARAAMCVGLALCSSALAVRPPDFQPQPAAPRVRRATPPCPPTCTPPANPRVD